MCQSERKRDAGSRMYNEDVVLNMMLQGKSRADICEALHMPLGTVNNYCTRIYKRTGCNSLVQLVLKHNAPGTDKQENSQD